MVESSHGKGSIYFRLVGCFCLMARLVVCMLQVGNGWMDGWMGTVEANTKVWDRSYTVTTNTIPEISGKHASTNN